METDIINTTLPTTPGTSHLTSGWLPTSLPLHLDVLGGPEDGPAKEGALVGGRTPPPVGSSQTPAFLCTL